MLVKYILKVFVIIFLFLSLIIFINSIGMKLHDAPSNKRLLQVVTIEPFTETNDTDILGAIAMNKSNAFCEIHAGSSGTLEESCGKLTKNNCSSTSCCVWTSDNKCLIISKINVMEQNVLLQRVFYFEITSNSIYLNVKKLILN
jgi:hypothetical protein